jgi:hypothetical protein
MKKFDGLDEVFEVESEIVPQVASDIKKVEESDRSATKDQIKKDYEVSRAQLHNLVMKGQEAIDGILELAHESEQPRAYEVAGQLIKHVGDVTDKLMDLQKKLADIEEPQSKTPSTVNNALFVGSTADLQKLLKQHTINKKETK